MKLPQQLVWVSKYSWKHVEERGMSLPQPGKELGTACPPGGSGNCTLSFGRRFGRRHQNYKNTNPMAKQFHFQRFILQLHWHMRAIITYTRYSLLLRFCYSKILVQNLKAPSGNAELNKLWYISTMDYYAAVRMRKLFSTDVVLSIYFIELSRKKGMAIFILCYYVCLKKIK